MSHTESEIGVYTLSEPEFTRVRAAVKKAWNDQMLAMFNTVMSVYEANRGIMFVDAVRQVEEHPAIPDWQEELITPLLMKTGRGALAKPTKKALKDVEFDAIIKSQPFYTQQGFEVVPIGDGGIFFNPQACSIDWRVEPNNHAVDEAHQHPVGFAFLKALDAVRWTPGTGGKMTLCHEHDTRTYRVYGEARNPVDA